MICAREGSQWPVGRSWGWSTSPPTGWAASIALLAAPYSHLALALTFFIYRNLHSHHFSSPLTNQQEVSAFGEMGEGDTGDVWKVIVVFLKWNNSFYLIKKVVCDTDYWQRDQAVQFKHVDTGVYLGSSGQTFGRPISGQMEIIGTSRPDGSTKWRTQEVWWSSEYFPWMTLFLFQGIYIHPSDFNPKRQQMGHDEL